MKKMKKIASIILSMVMALVMTVPAFAASESPSASITIHNVAEDAIYTVYKVFGATYSGTGSTQLVAYTYPTDDASKAKWDAQVKLVNGQNENVLDKYFKWNRTTGVVEPKDSIDINSIFVVNDDTKDSVADLKNALKNIGTQVETKKATDGKDLTVDVSSSGFGYYLVESSRGTETAIAVDNVTPNAEIFDKNVSYPTWDDSGKKIVIVNSEGEKEVPVSSCGIGDEVTFRLHITAQNYAQKSDDINSEFKQIDKYIIKDDLANEAFTLVENSVKVTVNNANVTNFTKTDATTPEKGFIVNIPWIDAQGASLYEANSELVIEYKATLQDTAVIASSGNVNKAKLGWTVVGNNTPDKPGTEEEKTATVYTYALAFYKTNPDNQDLSGAEFEITGPNGGKIYATGDSYPYTNAKSTDTGVKSTFTTDSNGLIIVKGVPAGTYSVKETKAPQGYNQLAEPVSVEAVLERKDEQKITIYKDAGGKVVSTKTESTTEETKDLTSIDFGVTGLTIVNKAGQLLPSTGGIGTTIFYIIGGILVVGAAVLLVTKKRMSKEA